MRTGENIHKRKDSRWEARYFDKERNKYISLYAKSYSEVKEKLNNLRSISNDKKSTKSQLYVKDISILYLNDIQDKVKKSTYAKYYEQIYNHIIINIGDIKIKNITQSHIDAFIKHLQETLSYKTTKDITLLLKHILDFNNMNFQYKVTGQNEFEAMPLSDRSYNILIDYLMHDTDFIKMGTLLSLSLGLRLGEICALKWSDVDFDNKTITISKTLQRIKNVNLSDKRKTIVIIDTPKSKKSKRIIPLQEYLFDILEKLQQKGNYYILTGNLKYIEPRVLQTKFKKILNECNIQDTNFHSLRHTFATRYAEKATDLKSLSEILGHSKVEFTLNRYVHSSLEQKRNELEKLCTDFY